MRATEGRPGRIFILRLDDGDIVPDCIEKFAVENDIRAAVVFLVGGLGTGRVVVGPYSSTEMPPEPMMLPVEGAHEVLGTGLIACDEERKPVLHMHGALGRSGQTVTGCLRPGVNIWLVGEVVIHEILGASMMRRLDPKSGFTLLEI